MQSYTITVGGQTFQIRSDANQAHIDNLAAEINKRYSGIEKRGPRASQEARAMAMVAIVLLDELNEARGRLDDLRESTGAFVERMIAKIDETLSQGTP